MDPARFSLADVARPATLFDRHAQFDPAGDFESFLKLTPAKWAVYLMADGEHRPVQLLSVKNLRASLKRRLGAASGTDERGGDEPAPGLSRRVDYRELIRHVYWRRVDSAFEADVVYLDAARQTFPQTYRGMTGFRPAWFVHVNPHTTYPRYTKTIDPSRQTGVYLGPLEDKHAAQKLVHLAESLFDLCRDYSVLTQSPHAGPCAWKQMGKCVGPCDGTVSLDAYRELVAHSAAVLSDPHDHVREQTRRMQQAAAELRFETAERIKAYVDQLAQLGKGPFRHVRPMKDFTHLSLQRGPRAGTAKVFLITPGCVEELLGIIAEPSKASDLLRLVLETAARTSPQIDQTGIEVMGVVAHHLFQAKAVHGVFLPLADVDEKSMAKAYRDLQKQRVQEPTEGEGVVKELQAM
jgi:excinuclease UvrABC nuclease subunit